MAITVNPLYPDEITGTAGPYFLRTILAASGLTTNAANTIPHGLPRTPRHVIPVPLGNAALGAVVSLDDSQGLANSQLSGGHLGWDATNIYVYIGNGPTEAMFLVDY